MISVQRLLQWMVPKFLGACAFSRGKPAVAWGGVSLIRKFGGQKRASGLEATGQTQMAILKDLLVYLSLPMVFWVLSPCTLFKSHQ